MRPYITARTLCTFNSYERYLGQYPDEVFGTPAEKAAVLRFQMDLEVGPGI